VLRGQVIVKSKIFSLRSRAPRVAPRGGYAMSDGVELVPLEQLPQHLQRLRDTKGEAKGLIPATKEIYQHLVDNHVQTYKVTKDDGDRYTIVPVPYLFAMLRLKEQTRVAHKRRAAKQHRHPRARRDAAHDRTCRRQDGRPLLDVSRALIATGHPQRARNNWIRSGSKPTTR
jgi:hypothetical protein